VSFTIIKNYPLLIGQILYRSFYNKSLFEEIRSKFLYENWFNEKIICPIYPIVPKGEVGINPNLKDFGVSYVTFKVNVNWNTKKIKLGKKIDIKICKNLIDKNKYSVR